MIPIDPIVAQPLALACVMSVSTTLTHNNASSLLVNEVEGRDDDIEATAMDI